MSTHITIETTTPEHDQDGYWSYDMTITIGETAHTIPCWKLATWLAAGAHQDIDGSGLANWGSSQPGGWRSLDSDSQSHGKPTVEISEEDEGKAIVSHSNDSVEIPIPADTDPDEFVEELQAAIDSAADAADPQEPDAAAVWQELPSYSEMENLPIRIGKVFGSDTVRVAYESGDGYESEDADDDEPSDELLEIATEKFKEEFRDEVRRAKED